MKRSEMNDHIYEEIKEALDNRQYSNETDEAYWRRRSAQILDMVLGFGMLPPTTTLKKLWIDDNAWESEDDENT